MVQVNYMHDIFDEEEYPYSAGLRRKAERMVKLKTAIIIAAIIGGYYLWSYIYEQVAQSVPPPYAQETTFFKPLSYRKPKKIVAKSEVTNKDTGEKAFALIAEDTYVMCIVDKQTYDAFQIGQKTDCYFHGKDTENAQETR